MENSFFNLVNDRKDMLKALEQSKLQGSVIGINSPSLGSGTFLTSVSEIQLPWHENPVIVLKSYDISGYFLDKNTVRLNDIISVIPFTSVFQNPFLKACKEYHH